MITEEELNELTGKIIGVAIDVHRELGPGLLEKVYLRCLLIALKDAGFHVEWEVPLPVLFRGRLVVEDGYRMDIIVEDTVILELKSVAMVASVHEKQLLTYLRLSEKPCGLLMNFNSTRLTDGIKRIRNGFLPPESTL